LLSHLAHLKKQIKGQDVKNAFRKWLFIACIKKVKKEGSLALKVIDKVRPMLIEEQVCNFEELMEELN